MLCDLYKNAFIRFKAQELLFCISLLSIKANKPFVFKIKKRISSTFLKNIKISLLFIFLCFSTGLAYKSEKESNNNKHDGSLSLDTGFYAKQNTYDSIQADISNNYGIEDDDFSDDYTEEESFKKDFDINTYGKTEEGDFKKYFQSFEGSYIPPYVKRAIINSLKPIMQISSRHLAEKKKPLDYFIKFFKRSFTASSSKLQKKSTRNSIYKRSFLHLSKRDQVQCVNFLEKLEDSSLNKKARECFKESIFFSGCPNIFDIPCLCRSNSYKSHIALCIYQKSTVQLINAFAFASEICSSYESLPSSCISSLMADSSNIYKKYNFKDKIDTSKESSSSKEECSKSYSIFTNFSILTLIFIVAGAGIFVQTGILSLV
ncbi:hypothetical protein PNEG_02710 [Pneumocystis murina B123]|uniref:CFEM domain-containing protein n=1 Tax=Pneumocystis murina (strain B123) TaxID=1069680 RepID=M7PEN7_PNEMU|nr:hypothetical protein PNEG_02710 [Pneumocystis murina B123]EMR08929.1 hypothetical protein PNEG_02710 [Pneumocystis murina B123]